MIEMTRKEELREAYEEALFALLMEEMEHPDPSGTICQLGGEVPLAVPKDVDDACHEILEQAAAKQRRQKAGRSVRRVLTLAALAAMAAVLLLTTAFAVSEDFRVNTLNLLIEISDVSARLTINGSSDSSALPDQNQTTGETLTDTTDPTGVVLMGYQFPAVPEGFEVEFEKSDPIAARIKYSNAEGAALYFYVKAANGTAHSVDTEGAKTVENIQINGYNGLLVEKDGWISIVWLDTDQAFFIDVLGQNLSRETVEGLARAITYAGAQSIG